jgi:integrase
MIPSCCIIYVVVFRWLKESAHKATRDEDISKLRWLDKFLVGTELTNINRALIDRITEAKQAEGGSNATVNRTLALLRAILRRCHRDWEWLDRAPAVRLLKEPTRRIRFLTQDQAVVLLRELPQHLKDMATFALATGLRAANITGLCWEQVNMERKQAWVHPDQAKARRAIAVPLNDAAMEVLGRQKGNHFVKVFTYEGEPVKQVSTKAWYKALKRAGIENFRFHDLRHCWASWHVQNGTPLHVLQELGGWETPAMVRPYAHLAVGHLAAYADRAGIMGTNSSQGPNA